MLIVDASLVLNALIHLNRLEDELKSLSPRSTRRGALVDQIQSERSKIPPFILAHHDRLRARGRVSTVPVLEGVCRGCFISVPVGLRTRLASREDLNVCDNCGSYIYQPNAEEQAAWEADLARKRELAAQASAPAKSAAKKNTGVKSARIQKSSGKKTSAKVARSRASLKPKK